LKHEDNRGSFPAPFVECERQFSAIRGTGNLVNRCAVIRSFPFPSVFFCNRKVLTTSRKTNKRIDSPRSKGCHDLIKKGAKLCEGAEDILSEFEYLFPRSNKPPSPGETGVLPALELSDNEQKVLDSLDGEERMIDEIIRKSGLPSSAVSVALLSLEMKRLVKQLPGKLFIKNL
jgi:predicted Rossmann fold nucleotide-binding protein DprA/Smf involved in DNA uptake